MSNVRTDFFNLNNNSDATEEFVRCVKLLEDIQQLEKLRRAESLQRLESLRALADKLNLNEMTCQNSESEESDDSCEESPSEIPISVIGPEFAVSRSVELSPDVLSLVEQVPIVSGVDVVSLASKLSPAIAPIEVVPGAPKIKASQQIFLSSKLQPVVTTIPDYDSELQQYQYQPPSMEDGSSTMQQMAYSVLNLPAPAPISSASDEQEEVAFFDCMGGRAVVSPVSRPYSRSMVDSSPPSVDSPFKTSVFFRSIVMDAGSEQSSPEVIGALHDSDEESHTPRLGAK